jgi:hypothetical protein
MRAGELDMNSDHGRISFGLALLAEAIPLEA